MVRGGNPPDAEETERPKRTGESREKSHVVPTDARARMHKVNHRSSWVEKPELKGGG